MPKKFKWSKSKPAKEQPLADPNNNTTEEQKRQICGDVHVRGEVEVETKFPPKLVEEHGAANKEETAHRQKTFRVELTTMIAVIVYAGLAFWQGCLTQGLGKTAKDQIRISARPWVGINDTPDGMQFTPLSFDANGDARISTVLIMRNFSGSAAQNVSYMGFLVISDSIADVDAKQAEACKDGYVGFRRSRDVLFPNSNDRHKYVVGDLVTRDKIKVGKSGKTNAWWVGCIGYRDQLERSTTRDFSIFSRTTI
jgi:hypothetical protein